MMTVVHCYNKIVCCFFLKFIHLLITKYWKYIFGMVGKDIIEMYYIQQRKIGQKQSYRNVFFRGMMEQQPYYDKLHAKNISIRFVSLSFEK